MILPLPAASMPSHGAFRALGFRSRRARVRSHAVHLYERAGKGTRAAREMNRRLFARPPRPVLLVAPDLPRHWRSPSVQQAAGRLRRILAGLPP